MADNVGQFRGAGKDARYGRNRIALQASCALGVALSLCVSCDEVPRSADDGHTVDLCTLLSSAEYSENLSRALGPRLIETHEFEPLNGLWHSDGEVAYENTFRVNDAAPSFAVRSSPRIADASLELEIRLAPGGRALSTGGLLFRMAGENGLGLGLSEAKGLTLLKFEAGRSKVLAFEQMEIVENRWYGLQVAMTGGRFVVHLDGRQVLAEEVDQAPSSGGIGLFRAVGEGAAFRNLSVNEGAGPTYVTFDFPRTPRLIAPLVSRSAPVAISMDEQPWSCLVQTVELNHDYRQCLIVPPDSEIRIPVDIRENGLLQYELGVLSLRHQPTSGASRVTVAFMSSSRQRTALRMHYLSSDGHANSWVPTTIELSELEQHSGFLVFQNKSIGEATGAYAAFARPTLFHSRDIADHLRPNILLIVIDTLRADHLGTYGYHRDTSPFLDSLASRGVLFERAIAQSSWTKTSMASLLTSSYPETNGVRGVDDRLDARFVTVAETLKMRGYFTAGVQTNPWIHPRFQMAQGFSEYHVLSGNASASRVNEKAVDILHRRGTAPFFLYLHYMDVHHPYAPPQPYQRFGNERKDLYDGEIRYLDDQLAGLFGILDEMGHLDNTLVVVTSDHGEEFLEHGKRYHGGTLYREQLHVPWILSWKDQLPAGLRLTGRVRNLDIVPTLVDLVGIRADDSYQGVSLKQRIYDRDGASDLPLEAFAQVGLNDVIPDSDLVCVLAGTWKYIKNRNTSWHRLFDHSVDPSEQTDLCATHPEIAGQLAKRLEQFVREHGGEGPVEKVGLDEELIARLRSLGYLGSSD